MSDERLKTKVGALILVAVTLLVGFVVLLGGFTVGAKRTLYVELADSGSMLYGAPVKIAGVRAGRVDEVRFLVDRDARRSEPRREAEPRVNVRVRVLISVEMAPSVRHDSEFYVTTQGVLGEKYLEILPGSPESPEWAEGSYIRGNDPPRVDLLFAKADAILGRVDALLSGGGDLDLADLVTTLTRLIKNLDRFLEENRERMDRIVVNVDGALVDGRAVVAAARAGVGDGSEVRAILANARQLTSSLVRDAGPLTAQARTTLARADASLAQLQDLLQAHRSEIDAALGDLPRITERVRTLTRDAVAIASGLAEGRGTVGQLLVERELYDDIKEMLRDLKRHPWKVLWKE